MKETGSRISDAIVGSAFVAVMATAFVGWFAFALLIRKGDLTFRGCHRIMYRAALWIIDAAYVSLARMKWLISRGG